MLLAEPFDDAFGCPSVNGQSQYDLEQIGGFDKEGMNKRAVFLLLTLVVAKQ